MERVPPLTPVDAALPSAPETPTKCPGWSHLRGSRTLPWGWRPPLPGGNRPSPVLGPGEPPPSAQGSVSAEMHFAGRAGNVQLAPWPAELPCPPPEYHQRWPFREGWRAASPPETLPTDPREAPSRHPAAAHQLNPSRSTSPPLLSPAQQSKPSQPSGRSRYPPHGKGQSLPREDSASTGATGGDARGAPVCHTDG